jgi:PPOX class probable F420-dependent enzyme
VARTASKVDPTRLAFDDVAIAAYLTFMEQMDAADVHLVAGRREGNFGSCADRTVARLMGSERPLGPTRREGVAVVSISAPAQALLGSDAVAHAWTNNADGSPQVSVVWVIAHGDEIIFGTDQNSRKAKNLRRDPRIILSIEDSERNERGFQRHLVIRGRATIEPTPDPVVMDRLAATYGFRHHPLALHDSPDAVMVRVVIDRVSGVGPWADTAESTATVSA